jgi:hypothetical protein
MDANSVTQLLSLYRHLLQEMVFTLSNLMLLYLGAWSAPVIAESRNVTIDDSSDLIQYQGLWPKGPCSPGCTINPDPSQFHDQSWHDNGVSRHSLTMCRNL